MRVAFVMGTTSGGTGRHVRMLAGGLARRGHRVLVAGPASVEEQFAFTEAGARFVPVRVSDRPHPLDDARSVLALRRLTRDADVVHAHGLRAGALAALALPGRAALLARRPSRKAGGPSSGGALVVTLHNALTAGGLVGVVYGVLERVVARRADHVLVVSPDLGQRMVALGAGDVRAAVVPGRALRPAKRTPEEVRSELGAGRRPIVLTLARLAQQKGLETLLDVARGPWQGAKPEGHATEGRGSEGQGSGSVEQGAGTGAAQEAGAGSLESEAGEDARPLFVVAGEGPLRGALQDRIDAERLPVTLLGNRDDVPDLLAAATVVVWPSRWEGLPLSLSEALMAGRPVVATAVGGIPGLLAGAGRLVPYGDAGAMRAAVRELVADPAAAARMAAASARRGAELPGDEDAVDSVLSVYGDRQGRG
ncbi:glycosyltransferase family 4 protein [Nonomuraea sp. 3-1Str]|uniref:glycosyltransferase family 4 protein n=1 Tax=Nonomuraea sp. 3-1Str TaxID=2929801 RepID=UPI00286739C6|nr:glycosyltransferase family 4 protein [Nonomuraea sp. 3-1Str]MDR8409185.1 glycosyltransferase family 4 protein [Nonomuraea sp. 3-1Str]